MLQNYYIMIIFVFFLIRQIQTAPSGSGKQIEISLAIREGAIAFLKRQYKPCPYGRSKQLARSQKQKTVSRLQRCDPVPPTIFDGAPGVHPDRAGYPYAGRVIFLSRMAAFIALLPSQAIVWRCCPPQGIRRFKFFLPPLDTATSAMI